MSDKTNCPNCGAPIDAGKSKCPYCDTPYQHIRLNYSGPRSCFDEATNSFKISIDPDGIPVFEDVFSQVLTPNQHRALHGLPPIGRKNGKSLGPHTLMEVDVNELMKEEKDV